MLYVGDQRTGGGRRCLDGVIREKRSGGHDYYQLVENYREGGKHRQRVLAYLGKHATVEDAAAELKEKLATLEPYVVAFSSETSTKSPSEGLHKVLPTDLVTEENYEADMTEEEIMDEIANHWLRYLSQFDLASRYLDSYEGGLPHMANHWDDEMVDQAFQCTDEIKRTVTRWHKALRKIADERRKEVTR